MGAENGSAVRGFSCDVVDCRADATSDVASLAGVTGVVASCCSPCSASSSAFVVAAFTDAARLLNIGTGGAGRTGFGTSILAPFSDISAPKAAIGVSKYGPL